MLREAPDDDTDAATTEKPRRFCRARHVQQAELSGTTVLFDGEDYYTLSSGTSADLWRLLAEPRSAGQLAGLLCDEYDAPREVIETDVAAQLLALQRKRLTVEVGREGRGAAKPRAWCRFWRRAQ